MIIFDTETTSLNPEYGQIAQLSYVKIDENNNVEFAKNFYFTVDHIEPGASEINGLTKELLEKFSDNKTFKDFSGEIYEDFSSETKIIAHNIEFDVGFLLEELKRLGKDINVFDEKEYFCTMQYYTDILNIEHSYYGVKFPRLDEVVSYLKIKHDDISAETNKIFGSEGVTYHDARFDVISTLNIYKYINFNFRKYDNMKKMIAVSESFKYQINEIKDILNQKSMNEITIKDMDKITDFYEEILDEENYFEKAVNNILSSAQDLLNYISIAKNEIQEIRDLEIKEEVELALSNENCIVRKCIISEEMSFGRKYREVTFDIQYKNEYTCSAPIYNVDLIRVAKNKFVMFNYNADDVFLLEFEDEIFDNNEKKSSYLIKSMKKCPLSTTFIDRAYDVNPYKIYLDIPEQYKRECVKNNDKFSIVNDEEIPF